MVCVVFVPHRRVHVCAWFACGVRLRFAAGVNDDFSMADTAHDFGQVHANAPRALAQFAFLIGSWRFVAAVKVSSEETLRFDGTWIGRYILDGHAIADEYRMTDAKGKLLVLGLNLRTYEESRQRWNIKWLNALTGAWTDLAPSELGDVHADGRSVRYAFRDTSPMDPAHVFTRATYESTSPTRFRWKGEKSSDGQNWSEFMVVDCTRVAKQP